MFITVPFLYKERNQLDKLNKRLSVAKQDYLEATGYSIDDVEFVSTIDKVANDNMMIRMGVKHPRLQNLVTGIDDISCCDEVMLGRNWFRSKFCKALLNICETYEVPIILVNNTRMMPEKTKKYYEKLQAEYNINILYKEF